MFYQPITSFPTKQFGARLPHWDRFWNILNQSRVKKKWIYL